MAVGTVGGVVKVHPTVRAALRVMEVLKAADLAELAASAGLAQNLAALRALAAEGIQSGHMRLHARNLAVAAGASAEEVDLVIQEMVNSASMTAAGAASILERLRAK